MTETRSLTLADLPALTRRFAAELPGRGQTPEDLQALFTETLTAALTAAPAEPPTPRPTPTHLLLEGWQLKAPPDYDPDEDQDRDMIAAAAGWPRHFAGSYLIDHLPSDRSEIQELLSFIQFVGEEIEPE